MLALTAENLALALLISGALLFVILAVFAVRAAARLAIRAPELESRLSHVEAVLPVFETRIEEAADVAEKARRIASKRDMKRKKAAKPEPEGEYVADEAAPQAANAHQNLFDMARNKRAARRM